MMKGLMCYEPYATLSECYIQMWHGIFAWSKEMQTLPGWGGTGMRGGKKGVVGPNAAPVVYTETVNRAITQPLYATAFVDEDGDEFPEDQIHISATAVPGVANQTTIEVKFTPPAGTLAGTYGGSILNSRYRLIVGPIQVDIPAG
jgi:hypothetical protein